MAHTQPLCPTHKLYNYTGRTDKNRCETPRVWHREDKFGIHHEYLSRCGKCDPCRAQKKSVRIARAMNEVETSNRTWCHTFTFGIPYHLRYLADHGDPAALSIIDSGEPPPASWQRKHAQYTKAGWFKRLRKATGLNLRQSTHWEAHESGQPHAHILVHEELTPVLWYEFLNASFITPRGYDYPQRGPDEGRYAYAKRLCHHLHEGWTEWRSLAADPTDEAKQRRLQLPFQCGNTGKETTKLCRDNTRNRKRDSRKAVGYAAKAAAYSAKDGGRWSHSPGYGKPFKGFRVNSHANYVRAMAAMTALWLIVAQHAHATGPASPEAHRGAATTYSDVDGSRSSPDWCRLAAYNREFGPSGPHSTPYNPTRNGPVTTGPPSLAHWLWTALDNAQ